MFDHERQIMRTYLARVTGCVHQHLFCAFTDCPGGVVTRIEPDYEAAARRLAAQNYGVAGLSDWQWGALNQMKERMRLEARLVVDAALRQQGRRNEGTVENDTNRCDR